MSCIALRRICIQATVHWKVMLPPLLMHLILAFLGDESVVDMLQYMFQAPSPSVANTSMACELVSLTQSGTTDIATPAGLQPVLVHMSKNTEGKFSFNPVSVNFLVEVVKTFFAIVMLMTYVRVLLKACNMFVSHNQLHAMCLLGPCYS